MTDDFRGALMAALGRNPAPPPPTPEPSNRWLDMLKLTLAPNPEPRQPARRPPDYRMNAGDEVTYDGRMQGIKNTEALAASPFADSLRALLGDKPVIRYAGNGYGNGSAMYGQVTGPIRRPGETVARDTVNIFSPTYQNNQGSESSMLAGGTPRVGTLPERILAHEMGHRYANQSEAAHNDLGTDAKRDAFDTTIAASPMQMRPAQYGSASHGGSNEHYAEAFANAVDFLRATATTQPTGPPTALATEYERAVPGTRMVVQDLLTNPVYARHPLNQGRYLTRPDATAVRR